MKFKDYSEEIWQKIENALKRNQNRTPQRLIAAFDADGTLWNTDLGEAFFQFQIDKKLIPLPPDPWDYYRTLKKRNNDPREAYLWLAQINEGIPLKTLQEWAKEALSRLSPVPVFEAQSNLISKLLKSGVEIYIVTASVKWAVDPGAGLFGLSDDSVIGVETFVDKGIITKKQKGVITFLEGKVEALLEKTKGQRPFLAAGNSTGDIPLLASSTEIQIGVSGAELTDRLYQNEMELGRICGEKSWFFHRFISE